MMPVVATKAEADERHADTPVQERRTIGPVVAAIAIMTTGVMATIAVVAPGVMTAIRVMPTEAVTTTRVPARRHLLRGACDF